MCGIAGLVGVSLCGDVNLEKLISPMVDVLEHRGPDSQGLWTDAQEGVALGHRRLSVIDLSTHGLQPMISNCTRYVVSYNGEIYNHRELRVELERAGYTFRGFSDTEVLLAAVVHWGFVNAIKRLDGMFAIAVWDRQTRAIHLAVDRVGEKPLYYGVAGDVLIFASELKALVAFRGFRAEIDPNALALYFQYKYIPYPFSIYRGVKKLQPGTFVTFPVTQYGRLPDPEVYWSFEEVAINSLKNPLGLDESATTDYFDGLLGEVVESRMVSDVPLGAFLSGGIDSSAIVAMMQKKSRRAVESFTIGFKEADYDEARYARQIASHLGTSHTEMYVTPAEAMEVIPDLPRIFDEPFADSSQIPTFLVSRLARSQVTVVLSGDGGDELFAGYWRHFFAPYVWNRISPTPLFLRKGMSSLLTSLSPANWDKFRKKLDLLLPSDLKGIQVGDRIHKLSNLISAGNKTEVYTRLVSDWHDENIVNAADARQPSSFANFVESGILDFANSMMLLDSQTYLPGDILTKVDRASMAVSLESRVPYLDPRIIEFAWRLPADMKVRRGKGKWLLRQLLKRYVPEKLFDRPKTGFEIPIDSWLRGPLKEWAEELLDEKKLREQGLLNPALIRQKWDDHIGGQRNWQHHLWSVLMFQAWYEKWMHSR